jgi:plasmid stabilization system protein ParE
LNSILKRLSVAVAADLPLAPVGLEADQPKMGKVLRHRRLRLRLLTHDDYLVFYRERPGVIEIVRVIHGRRNVPDILDEL